MAREKGKLNYGSPICARFEKGLEELIVKDAHANERTPAAQVRLIVKEHYRAKGIDLDTPAPEAPGGEGTPPGSAAPKDEEVAF